MSSNGDAFLGQELADDGLEAAADPVVPLANAPLASDALAPQAITRQRQGGWRRWAVLAAAGLVGLALIGSGTVYALWLNATAAVMIIPRSSDLKQTFTLTGVTGTPDASKQQVGARMISVTTPAQTKTVNATGQENFPGTQASGTLIVTNFDSTHPLNFATGDEISSTGGPHGGSGLTMVLDAPVNLPAAPTSGVNYTYTLIPGHVLQVGSIGNSSCANCSLDYLYHGAPPSPGCPGEPHCWQIGNDGLFSGGQDAYNGPDVQQSDIDGAERSLIQANQPDPQRILQSQIQPNEQLVSPPQCTPNTSADHQAGDRVAQVTVTVTFTCTGDAYDHAGALALAATLLKEQVASTPGSGYALVGQLKTTLLSATLDTQGTVQILVQTEGIWVYQFSAAEMQALAKLIAGKSKPEAQRILTTQPGVSQAAITLAGGIGQTLPTDLSKITIAIKPITGF